MVDNLSKFSENLKDLLIQNNINPEVLAKNTKINKSQLSLYLRGVFYPSVKNALKIVNYFNCSLDFLFGLSDKFGVTSAKTKTTFYERIIKLINSFNISQYKLCKDINISDANFAKWKKGVLPQFETLLNISQYFNCSLDYLIARSDS